MFNPIYYITLCAVTLGASTQFYSFGIVNPEEELLKEWINETYFLRNENGFDKTKLNFFWSLTVSVISVGAIFGALLTRTLAETLGRRNALIVSGIVNVGAALLEYFSKTLSLPEFLIFGRFILGANMGISSGIVPMYLLEISPTNFRGTAGTFHQVAVAFSDWFSLLLGMPEILGGENTWPIAFAFPGIPAFFMCCILPFCPESPKYTLIKRGKRDKALKDINRLVGENDAKEMFNQIVKETALLQDGTGTYKDIFYRKELRIPLIVAVIVMIAQQFTGCSAVFAYSSQMFLDAGFEPTKARYSTLAIGIAYFLFACSAPFLIERVGRRVLLLFQLILCTISLCILSIFTFLYTQSKINWVGDATIGALIVYMCVYGVGSPIPWMITCEMFPTKFRSAAVTVAVFVSYFFSFIISTFYPHFKELVGVSFSFLPFILVSIVTTIILYILLPETRGIQPTDIVQEISMRVKYISIFHPTKIYDYNVNKEEHSMMRPRTSSTQSYHQYMSIGA